MLLIKSNLLILPAYLMRFCKKKTTKIRTAGSGGRQNSGPTPRSHTNSLLVIILWLYVLRVTWWRRRPEEPLCKRDIHLMCSTVNDQRVRETGRKTLLDIFYSLHLGLLALSWARSIRVRLLPFFAEMRSLKLFECNAVNRYILGSTQVVAPFSTALNSGSFPCGFLHST